MTLSLPLQGIMIQLACQNHPALVELPPSSPNIIETCNQIQKNTHHSDSTSPSEGMDKSLASDVWEKVATCECRIELIQKLMEEDLGLHEVEDIMESLNFKIRGVN